MELEERFWSKVDSDAHDPDRCWEWCGAVSGSGYGYFNLNGKTVRAHRLAYELEVGPIPAGKHLDHLCRNRTCVNPGHLEPVTQRTNTLRGVSPAAKQARLTACSKCSGPYSPDGRGKRVCLPCSRTYARERARKIRRDYPA